MLPIDLDRALAMWGLFASLALVAAIVVGAK
jgi:hypothetical protein